MLEYQNVSKVYEDGTVALSDFNSSIDKGEFVTVLGPSGAGKSTLLRCTNRLVEPTSGKIFLNEVEILKLKGKKLRKTRQNIGMIFQQFNLVRRLSVIKNVLSGRLSHSSSLTSVFHSFGKRDYNLSMECLERVSLDSLANRRADTLSGGQQQRVAIARGLAQEPEVILADEPVASLDPRTAREIMELLKEISRQDKITVIVNLHMVDLAKEFADRIIGLAEGKIVLDGDTSLLDEYFRTIYYGDMQEELREENSEETFTVGE
ncbi:phosphonate ABC transporter ATP-binding protein [Candidatus Poribacteria bacterium]|nr:phosphonate ABC transporter ATP-binding protein [Candidatus Poribacteria bacterium]